MKALALVLSGAAAGTASGLLGIGGAILATPLLRFLGVAPYLAVGTTVPVMLPTTITGGLTYRAAGFVDRRAVWWTSLGAVPASIAGAFATRLVNGHVLMLVTAGILILLGLRLAAPPEAPALGEGHHPSPALLAGTGVAAGLESGLLVVGGGFIMVPAFGRLARFPIKLALGTSLAVIAVVTIPNTLAQAVVGNISWRVAALLALGVVPGARLGARLALRVEDRSLRRVVLGAVVAVALVYAVSELAALFSR